MIVVICFILHTAFSLPYVNIFSSLYRRAGHPLPLLLPLPRAPQGPEADLGPAAPAQVAVGEARDGQGSLVGDHSGVRHPVAESFKFFVGRNGLGKRTFLAIKKIHCFVQTYFLH